MSSISDTLTASSIDAREQHPTLFTRTNPLLVLDLDNTLWGGIIGDDGLDGILIGQGSAVGEAYLAFQHYAKQLKERGVILAVCTKNDADVAEAVFSDHPEMALRRSDFERSPRT